MPRIKTDILHGFGAMPAFVVAIFLTMPCPALAHAAGGATVATGEQPAMAELGLTPMPAWDACEVDILRKSFKVAPPIDMPAFDEWFDRDIDYVQAMYESANRCDADSEWLALVDCDLCRMTMCIREDGRWKACGGYSTFQGVAGVHGGSEWVPACYGIQPTDGTNPADRPLSRRHVTDGDTKCRGEVALWVSKNIASDMTIILFDQDGHEMRTINGNEAGDCWDVGLGQENVTRWIGDDVLPSASYDREAACGRSHDEKSGHAGHVSHSDLADLTDAQRDVLSASDEIGQVGAGMCLAWVNEVFDYAGHGFERLWAASEACQQWCHSTDRDALLPGMIVAVESTDTSPLAGHIGIYIGDGRIRDNETLGGEGVIKTRPIDEWLAMFGTTSTPRWGWAGGVPLC